MLLELAMGDVCGAGCEYATPEVVRGRNDLYGAGRSGPGIGPFFRARNTQTPQRAVRFQYATCNSGPSSCSYVEG